MRCSLPSGSAVCVTLLPGAEALSHAVLYMLEPAMCAVHRRGEGAQCTRNYARTPALTKCTPPDPAAAAQYDTELDWRWWHGTKRTRYIIL